MKTESEVKVKYAGKRVFEDEGSVCSDGVGDFSWFPTSALILSDRCSKS